jgi:hypothetical protein
MGELASPCAVASKGELARRHNNAGRLERGVAVEGKRKERCRRCGLRGDDNGDDGVRVD